MFHDFLQFQSKFRGVNMECRVRLSREYVAVLLAAKLALEYTQLEIHDFVEKTKKKSRRKRSVWTRPWLSVGRRRSFGLYDQLLQELRREDKKTFRNFMRMPPEMFDELLERLRPRITKQMTFYREPLDPGMKLAITLRHLASGSKYTNMRFGWRVPHNTISLVVREVCRYFYINFIIFHSCWFMLLCTRWKRF